MMKLAMSLALAGAVKSMPVDHRAERQAMVRTTRTPC